jgi:hypothetical protein
MEKAQAEIEENIVKMQIDSQVNTPLLFSIGTSMIDPCSPAVCRPLLTS